MKLNPPHQVRVVLYVLTAIGTPVVAYLNSRDVIGADEVTLWSALAAVVGGLAALNTVGRSEASVIVDVPADVDVRLDERGATDVVTVLVAVVLVVLVLVLLGVLR